MPGEPDDIMTRKCRYCGFETACEQTYALHEHSHKDLNWRHMCPYCAYGATSEDQIRCHISERPMSKLPLCVQFAESISFFTLKLFNFFEDDLMRFTGLHEERCRHIYQEAMNNCEVTARFQCLSCGGMEKSRTLQHHIETCCGNY